jgi:hypothetical protein
MTVDLRRISKDSPRQKGNGAHRLEKPGGRAGVSSKGRISPLRRQSGGRIVRAGRNQTARPRDHRDPGTSLAADKPSMRLAKVENLTAIVVKRFHSTKYKGNNFKEMNHLGLAPDATVFLTLVKSPGLSRELSGRRGRWDRRYRWRMCGGKRTGSSQK